LIFRVLTSALDRRRFGGFVAARWETKRQVEQDFLRFESARRLAASRDFNVGVGVCVGVGVSSLERRRRDANDGVR
jgi:hypothetical protein